jgi:hypothetical protein
MIQSASGRPISSARPGSAAAHARPEIELLLCCARTRMDAAQAARVRARLQAAPDWEWLMRAAEENGAKALVSWNC